MDGGRAERLTAVLSGRYGLAVGRLEPAARGWTGETYAATAGGARYFVKVFPSDRRPPTALPALPVLAELHRLGIPEASRPVPTTDGALHAWLGDDLVVVFGYLDAARVVPFPFGGARLGDLLARLHASTPRIAGPVVRETFPLPDPGVLWGALARAREEPTADAPGARLRRFLDEQAAFIADGWAALGEIADACRAASFELVLTHGDWPFNLLRDVGGSLHLVDWDELVLAPAERDTWFAAGDADFRRAYAARRRGHGQDELAAAFYLHGRYFEGLLGAVRVILGELGDGTPERRARVAAGLDNPWFTAWAARMRAWAAA